MPSFVLYSYSELYNCAFLSNARTCTCHRGIFIRNLLMTSHEDEATIWLSGKN